MDKGCFCENNVGLVEYLNRKIADIQYDILNLPSQITFEDRNSVKSVYDVN